MSFIITNKAGITDLSQENNRNYLFKPEKKQKLPTKTRKSKND